MKKSIVSLGVLAFITGAILTSCNTAAEKVEKAQENVMDANKDLADANKEYQEDIENYRKETADKITVNSQIIADLKAKIEHEKKEAKTDYKKIIAELEQKNNEMKKKMDDYKAEGKEKWEKFKAEFNHDMDELGAAFKGLTAKNVK